MARADKDKLFELIVKWHKEGRKTTRTSARNHLDWNDPKIDRAIQENSGRIELGAWGYLSLKDKESSPNVYKKELDLYDPITKALTNDSTNGWISKKQSSQRHAFNVANRRGVKGIWSNPDILLIFLSRFKYHRNESLEVVTFEVKHSECLDIKSVYEALAHRRAATMSYLFVYYPHSCTPDDTVMEAVTKECSRLGIGLIVTDNVENSGKWEERIAAHRFDVDQYDLERFLDSILVKDEQDKIARWKA